MKQYKKPEILSADVLLNKNIMVNGSPNKSYDEEGNGIQLTRRQIWAEDM